jgi:hypothetical protein
MGVLANPWVRVSGALAIVVNLAGCVTPGSGGTVYSPNEAAVINGATVGGFGAAACNFVEDDRARRACFAAAAAAGVAAAADARARAATAGSCDQYDRTTRTASRDNTIDRVERDRTTQTRDEECSIRTPHRGGPRPGNIF